ncbi:hypothetical protein C0033_20775 [Clostridium sp. chh4-2]|nr:hypothetical protein C0033_20775 [Clostridium sp. chh4-2]
MPDGRAEFDRQSVPAALKCLEMEGKMKKRLFLLAALCACITGCAAPKESSQTQSAVPEKASTVVQEAASADKLGISWWGTQAVHEFTLEVCEKYTEKSGTELEAVYASWGDYWQKMNTLSAAGDLPDIMRQDYAVITQYADKGLLEPLDSYIESGKLDMSNVDPVKLEGGRINGKLYGINVGSNALCIVYDEEMIKEAGMEVPGPEMSWEDFEKFCIEFHEKTGKYGSTISDIVSNINIFEVIARSSGGTLYNEEGLGMGYDDAVLAGYFDSVKRMHDAGALPSIDTKAQQTSVEDSPFSKGEAATEIVWTDMYESLVAVKGKELGLTIIPGTGADKGMYVKPSQFLSVTSSSDKKEEAVDFINAWVNDSDINKIIAGRRGVPISTVMAEEVAGTLKGPGQRVFEYMDLVSDYASPIDPPNPAGASEVNAEYTKQFEMVLFGESDSETASSKFRANAEDALKAANK